MLKIILKVVKFLKDDANPHEVGLAFMYGFILGFQPFSLLSVVIFIIFFVTKTNKAAGFLGLAFFKLIAVLVEPAAVGLGAFFLTMNALEPFWTALRNIPIVPLTKFYNTAMLGGTLFGLVGFFPAYLISKKLYIQYKDKIKERVVFLRSKKKKKKGASVESETTLGGGQ